MQLMAGRRAEAAIPEQKRQKDMQELSSALAFGIQQKNGISNQELMNSTYNEAMRRGLKDQDVAELFQPWSSVANQTDGQEAADVYAQRANPQEAIKQRLEAQFGKKDEGTPVTVMQQGKPVTIMSKSGRIVGEAVPKQDMTLVQVQLPTGETVYQPRSAAAGMAVPQKAGKGGTPEDVAAAKEQASLSSQQVLDQAEKLFKHPGRGAGTGASSWMGNIPGTDAKGFQANLETFKSQTFLPMVSALKGMGALSDAEGKKITASVGALDPQMPEKEFESSLKDTTRFLFSKAKAAGLNVQIPSFMDQRQQPSNQGTHPEDIAAILAKHR
jgi:hypothetical protein